MLYDTQEVKQDDLMVPSGLKVYESMNIEQIQEMENKLPAFLKKCLFLQMEPNSTL